MPKVGIVMGSDSDLKVMSKAADMLEKLGIDYEMTIISAHRMPDVFFDWAKAAEGKGIKVIIAGAGMAAHLVGSEMCIRDSRRSRNGSTSSGNVCGTFPDASSRSSDVRKESGWNGCTLFDRSDAAGNSGCHCCD